MSLDDYVVIGPLCYQGKVDCDSVTCTRNPVLIDGKLNPDCRGYHCSYCDAPCGSQGHRCDAAKAILGASEQALREAGRIK